ncbi:MAG TPA: hypothetical protein PK239_09100 [Chitinophagales bacterium]|nr:hypothetical protein [Chitinophagales bacterium]
MIEAIKNVFRQNEQEVEKPSPLMMLSEVRTVFELGMYVAAYPLLRLTPPKGDGHPIMVLPGFMTGDLTTVPLRHFLNGLGYNAYPWNMGPNLADQQVELPLMKRVMRLYNRHNQKVTLIGWSLGGVYAREIARVIPDYVRQVITLASPFAGIDKPNNAVWIYQLIKGGASKADISPDLLDRIKRPVPVPTTAIYSKYDGVVSWQHCIEQQETPITQNIEVECSHSGFGHHPAVLMCVAELLAQPEDNWQKYNKTEGWRKWLYK